MPLPQRDPARDQITVKVKAPGGGSVSHEGVEYKPDADGNVTIPLHVKEAIEAIHHTPPVQGQPPVRVLFEPANEPQKREEGQPSSKPEGREAGKKGGEK
jgi:hypothetical protein